MDNEKLPSDINPNMGMVILEKINNLNIKVDGLVENGEKITGQIHKLDKRVEILEINQNKQEETDNYLIEKLGEIQQHQRDDKIKHDAIMGIFKGIWKNKNTIIIFIIIIVILCTSNKEILEILKKVIGI